MAFSVLEQVEKAKKPITVTQAAKICGVSRQAIYNAIETGRIPRLDDGIDKVRIDPRSWAHQLRRNNPAMKLAAAAS